MQHNTPSPLSRTLPLLGLMVGCSGFTTDKPQVVDVPTAGTYVGTLELERRAYAGGIRMSRRSCGATFVAVVDPALSTWVEFSADDCALGGMAGDVVVDLQTLDGLTPTGTPMGRVGGDLPEGTWEGTFMDDGSFTLAGTSRSEETFGVATEFDIVVEAWDLDTILDDDTGMGIGAD